MSDTPRQRLRRWARRAAMGGLVAFLLGAVVILIAVIAVIAVDLPAGVLRPESVESRRVRDRHGVLLREALSDAEGRGAWRPLAEISPWVPRAFVAIEDHRFFEHGGVDPRGVLRAAWANLRAGHVVAGGSTITQQVVQLVLPQPRTLLGKAWEALWALRLEREHDKTFILEQYVNRAPFGHGTIGIEAAARLYLDKPASRLSLAEAALLAGIPRAPSLNNPFTDPRRARSRKAVVLGRMLRTGAIDAARYVEAMAETVEIASRASRFAAPHFTTFVLAHAPAPGDVRTTLDARLQREVERLVAEVVDALADRHVTEAATVVLDNATGDVLAWVGSRDFFNAGDGQVDMVIGRRQPGSTLKPFIYGLALEEGFTPASRLPDVPIFFPTALGDYRPRNYDRHYHGLVTLRAALANSYNVPAVWLTNRLGVHAVHRRLVDVGFASLWRDSAYYGLGLALGNGEVQLLELANAYRALANEGLTSPVRWRRGASAGQPRRVMPPAFARLVTDILADDIARIPAFGRFSALDLPFPAAVKTGTSTDFTDNWTVGFTPEVTVAVWVGNFDGRPMEGVSGVEGAGRLWHRVMRAVMADRPPRAFSREGLVSARLCANTGAAFTAECRHGVVERFVAGSEPRPGPPAVGGPKAPEIAVVYPDEGDVFARSADVPGAFARVRLRARAPQDVAALVWEIDGRVEGTTVGTERWWPARPGRHRVRVWPADRPGSASSPVAFVVLR